MLMEVILISDIVTISEQLYLNTTNRCDNIHIAVIYTAIHCKPCKYCFENFEEFRMEFLDAQGLEILGTAYKIDRDN